MSSGTSRMEAHEWIYYIIYANKKETQLSLTNRATHSLGRIVVAVP